MFGWKVFKDERTGVIDMRFRAHESFFIRKGWLYKGLKNVNEQPDMFSNRNLNPSDILGIGTNMVRSLRYWLQATGLTEEFLNGGRHQEMTELANIIWTHDKYMEEMGTLWLIHYKLASNHEDATAWHYFFNTFNLKEFSKEDFVEMIDVYTKINNCETAQSSLEGDFDCIMNTYVSRAKSNPEKVNPENNIDCPLGELNLVDIVDKKGKIYRKTIPQRGSLNPLVVLAVIVDQANINELGSEIRINTILTSENNVGKIFNLDIITLMEILYELQKMEYIKVNRTAGLDVVKFNREMTFRDIVEDYYRSLAE